MKEALYKANVNIAKFSICSLDDSMDAIKAQCATIGYPVIIKAVDSSGSRGITIVHDESQIDFAVSSVKSVTRQNDFLVEELLDGDEFGADAYINNGHVDFIIPHGKYVYHANTGIPVGHYAPYDDEEVSRKTIQLMEKAIEAMGFDNCAINADIMLYNGEPYIIEIGGRAGATCIPELISINNGYDYYEKLIKTCLSPSESLTPVSIVNKASASRLIISNTAGKITSITGLDDIIVDTDRECGIYTFDLDKSVGDSVESGALLATLN